MLDTWYVNRPDNVVNGVRPKPKLRVYVAGPLSGNGCIDYVKNCRKMLDVAIEVHRMGAVPFVPCNDFLTGLVAGDFNLQDYQLDSAAWIPVCHALFRIPGISKGSDEEERIARENDVPVIYRMETLAAMVKAMEGES